MPGVTSYQFRSHSQSALLSGRKASPYVSPREAKSSSIALEEPTGHVSQWIDPLRSENDPLGQSEGHDYIVMALCSYGLYGYGPI